MNVYIRLSSTFFKIGLFTFGGGWAMIPIIEREVVDKYKWMDKSEFLDALAVSQSMPGILAVNMSIMVGNKLRGARGGLAATIGTVLPSFLVILAIALYFSTLYENPIVEKVFKGIRPAVVALIISPAFTTGKSAKINKYTIWIPITVAILIWQLSVSPFYFVLAGAIGGIIYCKYLKKS